MPSQFTPKRLARFPDSRLESRMRALEDFVQEFGPVDPDGGFATDAGFVGTELDTDDGGSGSGGGGGKNQNRRGKRFHGHGSGRRAANAADAEIDVDVTPSYQQQYGDWYVDNITGTAGPTEFIRSGVGAYPNQVVLLRPGSITGIMVRSNADRTAGTATVEVYVNGAGTGLTAVLNATDVNTKATFSGPGQYPVAAGDRVSLYWTTVGWTPTTADVVGVVEISGTGGA